jgi:hypothetical protein
MRFARWVFLAAAIYGIVAMAPQYFLEEQIGRDYPPAISHPEYFYGFVGVGLAWQLLFLLISLDPVRLRPAMLPAIVEKASFAIAVLLLYLGHRVPGVVVGFAGIDAVLGVLFAVAYYVTPSHKLSSG